MAPFWSLDVVQYCICAAVLAALAVMKCRETPTCLDSDMFVQIANAVKSLQSFLPWKPIFRPKFCNMHIINHFPCVDCMWPNIHTLGAYKVFLEFYLFFFYDFLRGNLWNVWYWWMFFSLEHMKTVILDMKFIVRAWHI